MSPDPPPRAASAAATAAAAALASAALLSALVAFACPQEVAGVGERRSPMWPLAAASGSVAAASALGANPWLSGDRAEGPALDQRAGRHRRRPLRLGGPWALRPLPALAAPFGLPYASPFASDALRASYASALPGLQQMNQLLRIGAGAPLSSVRLPGFPSHLFQPGGIYTLPGFLAGMRMGQEMLQMSMELNAALNGLGSYAPALPPLPPLPPLQRAARSARLHATMNNG